MSIIIVVCSNGNVKGNESNNNGSNNGNGEEERK